MKTIQVTKIGQKTKENIVVQNIKSFKSIESPIYDSSDMKLTITEIIFLDNSTMQIAESVEQLNKLIQS